MAVAVKGSDWFPVSIEGNWILYIMRHKRESMLIKKEGLFLLDNFVSGMLKLPVEISSEV